MSRTERLIVVIGLFALILIPSVVLLLSHPTQDAPVKDPTAIPKPGAPGAEHKHASLIVNIQGDVFDFGDKKYMLQSKLVHFEDDDPFVVHKHTTGVTIPYFLSTLKVFMDERCIDFQNVDPARKYCTNATNTLRMLVNGEEIKNPLQYEIKNDDRYLVYYGPTTGIQLKFLSNQVPPVPIFKEQSAEQLKEEIQNEAFFKNK